MEAVSELKPRVSFDFEVQKITGISADGTYQVQWAPAWVSKTYLVGCEHLIQEFLREQSEFETKQQSKSQLNVSSTTESDPGDMAAENGDTSTVDLLEVKVEPTEIEICPQTSSIEEIQSGDILDASTNNFIEYGMKDPPAADSGDDEFNEPHYSYPSQENSIFLNPVNRELILRCTFCQEAFTSVTELNLHLSSGPCNGNPLISMGSDGADIINASRDEPRGKTRVRHNPHTGKKLYLAEKQQHTCHFCEYSCKWKSHMEIHLRKHTGEKPFTCNFCGKGFAQKNQMHVHIDRYHEGARS